MAVARVGAAVGVDPQGLVGDLPRLVHLRGRGDVHGVAGVGVDKGLLPGGHHRHAAASQLPGEEGRQGLVHHVLLVAEAAAQIGLDDPYVPHRHPDGIRQVPPQGVGRLGAGDHHHLPALHIGKAGRVLQMAGMDRGHVERGPLHARHRVPGLKGERGEMDLPLLVHGKVHPAELIAGKFLVERRLRTDGRLRRQNRGKRLVLHPDLLRRPGGAQRRVRHHRRHVVAIIPDPPGQDQAVLNIPVGGVQRLGVARCGELMVRHLEAGQHRHNAGHGLRLRSVHPDHQAVCNCTVYYLYIQGVPWDQILHILGRAGDFRLRVHPADRYADSHTCSFLSTPEIRCHNTSPANRGCSQTSPNSCRPERTPSPAHSSRRSHTPAPPDTSCPRCGQPGGR